MDLLDFSKFVIADAILLLFLATISLYIVSMSFKTDTSFEKIYEALSITTRNIDAVNNRIDSIDNSVKTVHVNLKSQNSGIEKIDQDLEELKKVSTATVRELDSQAEFYRVLDDKVLSAKSKVWLMHLDPHAPDSDIYYADDERKKYFKDCAEKAIAQNGLAHPVEFRRIINIPTLDKLEWVERLIEDTKDLQNLHLAYINVGNVEFNDIPQTFPISVTSCQIIDNKSVFLLNPELNVVPEGKFKTCIIIENEKVVSVYKNYYDKIWDALEQKNSKKGCIIKNGPGSTLFTKQKQRIIDDINKNSLENSEGIIKV
jgi:hypothetical protein